MLKKLGFVVGLSALFAATAFAQTMDHSAMHPSEAQVRLLQGIGNADHPIATKNPEAQQYFDQGLNYIFAFNHEEARRSFEKAAELDPLAPMPLWGVALAVGPNYNDIDIGHERATKAMLALEQARRLAVNAPAEERGYVEALSSRYGKDASGAPEVRGQAYANAMAALTKQFPADPDAAVLFAESLMDLNPWKLWAPDGTPAENTLLIVSTLQGVLAQHPNDVGANHLLIHAVEASPEASIAKASADRLRTLAPNAGHLVHMPAHIYERIGNYDGAAASNRQAVQVDQAYFKAAHIEGVENMYYTMYYVHNIHFLAASCSMEGNNICTQKAAKELVAELMPGVKDNPQTEWFTPTEPWMLVRFNHWTTILDATLPSKEQTPVLNGMWHYARGCAYAATGDLEKARQERDIVSRVAASLPAPLAVDFNNPATEVFTLATLALDARIDEAAGKRSEAIAAWKDAVVHWDKLAYNEPPDWYYPVRESLGGALLRDHQAKEAEAVFRADLKINAGNGRSLYGVWQSLLMQGRTAEAAKAEAAFREAWKHSDTQLSVAAL